MSKKLGRYVDRLMADQADLQRRLDDFIKATFAVIDYDEDREIVKELKKIAHSKSNSRSRSAAAA